MAYKILFTDIDGTLLRSDKEISAANIKAASAALSAGKKIVLNSGRSWNSLSFLEEQLKINMPGNFGSSFNGGVVYEFLPPDGKERKVLSQTALSNEKGVRIAASLREKGADVLLFTLNEHFAEQRTELTDVFSKVARASVHFVDSFSEVKEDVIKVIAQSGDHEYLERLRLEMADVCDGDVYSFFSNPKYLEFGPLAAHKGYSVKFLADYLHIPLDEVIAMGDEGNDITMLKTAGLGIAVANATAEAKAAANVVLEHSNDEDAFARVIEKYLL